MLMEKIFIHDLSEGIHEFKMEIRAEEIEIAHQEFYPYPLSLNIMVDKIQDVFRFKIHLQSQARYRCDRCLDEFETGIDEVIEQIYQLGHSELDEDEEIEILPVETREIDISKVLQDTFLMTRPLQLLCKQDCKGLCSKCGANWNHENCSCSSEQVDPRLEKLKLLIK
jgi:uncharacterized protein